MFALRSSSETDVEAALAREGFLDLLKPACPRSPQSPLGRSGSLRRTRRSPVATADRQLHTFLELTSDLGKFNNRNVASSNPPNRSQVGVLCDSLRRRGVNGEMFEALTCKAL